MKKIALKRTKKRITPWFLDGKASRAFGKWVNKKVEMLDYLQIESPLERFSVGKAANQMGGKDNICQKKKKKEKRKEEKLKKKEEI